MSSSPNLNSVRTPLHLWIIGVVSVLWGAMGAFDYLMTQTRNESYMAQYTPEQLEFYYGFPVWVEAAWAIAVWGGLLGAVFLLLRKSWALPTFIVSLVAMVLTVIHNYFLSNGFEVAGGTFPLVFTGVIFVVGVLQVWYAKAMSAGGVLK